jgi:hypothetical protein
LGGKLEEEIPFGRREGRWGNNIKMDAKGTVCVCVCVWTVAGLCLSL